MPVVAADTAACNSCSGTAALLHSGPGHLRHRRPRRFVLLGRQQLRPGRDGQLPRHLFPSHPAHQPRRTSARPGAALQQQQQQQQQPWPHCMRTAGHWHCAMLGLHPNPNQQQHNTLEYLGPRRLSPTAAALPSRLKLHESGQQHWAYRGERARPHHGDRCLQVRKGWVGRVGWVGWVGIVCSVGTLERPLGVSPYRCHSSVKEVGGQGWDGRTVGFSDGGRGA